MMVEGSRLIAGAPLTEVYKLACQRPPDGAGSDWQPSINHCAEYLASMRGKDLSMCGGFWVLLHPGEMLRTPPAQLILEANIGQPSVWRRDQSFEPFYSTIFTGFIASQAAATWACLAPLDVPACHP